MIFSLSGTVTHLGTNFFVIENNGIGYQVLSTTHVLSRHRVGESAMLWISHIITDSSQTLFGFGTMEERTLFEQLLTVSGVGGRTAINIMGVAPADDLQAAIRSGDASMLTRVSGVGKRTAERIIVELKEKMGAGDSMSSTHGDAFDALVNLGYSASDIRSALSSMPPTADTQTVIKEALRKLAR